MDDNRIPMYVVMGLIVGFIMSRAHNIFVAAAPSIHEMFPWLI